MAYTPASQMNDLYTGGMIGPSDVPALQPNQFGQVGGPAFIHTDAQGNVKRTAGKIVQDPATGERWGEYADMPPVAPSPTAQATAGMPPITDPVELAQWHSQQEMAALQQFDQQLAAIQAPVQAQLDVSKQQYSVDFDTVANSNIPLDQKERRLQDLNAQYQKKWIGIKGKTQLDEQAIQQQKQQAAFKIQLQQTLRMKEIQTYAELARQGALSPESALRLQYKTMGYEIPVTAMKPEVVQNPIDQAKDLRVLIGIAEKTLMQYQFNEAKGDLHVVKPKNEWATNKFNPKKDLRPATAQDWQEYIGAIERHRRASLLQAELSNRGLDRQVTSLTSGLTPLSRSIRAATPQRSAPSQSTGQVIERGGQRWRVVGYDTDGEPLVERAQ